MRALLVIRAACGGAANPQSIDVQQANGASPIAAEDFAESTRDPRAKRRSIALDRTFVLYPSRGSLVPLEMVVAPPVLRVHAERRD